MSTRTIHMCLSVRGALKWPKRRLHLILWDPETGEHLTADEARDYLMDQLVAGREVLPMGECEGFDFKTGCPGHERSAP